MKIKLLIEELHKALKRLDESLGQPHESDLEKAGCIQYFEFCFELSWKTVRQKAIDDGINDCNSPKASLKYAFASNLISDEETWLAMLSARNRMSHTYNADDALDVYDSLNDFYRGMKKLSEVLGKIEKES
jgi:nucleotidyltransferase substrate binding protein (TIGR01987 family)